MAGFYLERMLVWTTSLQCSPWVCKPLTFHCRKVLMVMQDDRDHIFVGGPLLQAQRPPTKGMPCW